MINFPKIFKEDEPASSNFVLPLLPLRDIVVFPHMVAPLFVGRTKSVHALADAMDKDKKIFLATQKKIEVDNPNVKDICTVGTVGNVLQLLRLPDGTVKALVEGASRARIVSYLKNEDFFQVELEAVVEPEISVAESVALSRAVIESFEDYAKLNKNISKNLLNNVEAI